MNKYIYKVRFVTLYIKNIMHKHELIFGKQQQFQQQKNSNSLRSMNASCSILKNMPFFNFGS